MSNSVLRIPLDNGLVEEGSICVPHNSPLLFGSLYVVGFFLGKEALVLFSKLLLEGLVLLGGVDVLLGEELGFNLGEKIIVSGFFPSPSSQVGSQVAGFLSKSAS